MGFIKEPKGVDFVIDGEPLTEKDKMEISKFIKDYKAKSSIKSRKGRQSTGKSKSTSNV